MPDLFKEKAGEWDANQMRLQLSSAIGASILNHVPLHQQMAVMDFGAGTGVSAHHLLKTVKINFKLWLLEMRKVWISHYSRKATGSLP